MEHAMHKSMGKGKGKLKPPKPKFPKTPKSHQPRVGMKISKLMHEGKPPKQAQAMALNMDRAHRLGSMGGYMRKGE